MGKVKQLRHKFHLAAKKESKKQNVLAASNPENLPDILNTSQDNLFAGINSDATKLKIKLNEDVQSVKSFKSLKCQPSGILPKKKKLKMRRKLLLKKIDIVTQMKKEMKIREKRKRTPIIGDTNPLHDALPSLESLIKNCPNMQKSFTKSRKMKGIEKAKARNKDVIEGVKIFKAVLNNDNFLKNPKHIISQHVQAFVNQERQKEVNRTMKS